MPNREDELQDQNDEEIIGAGEDDDDFDDDDDMEDEVEDVDVEEA